MSNAILGVVHSELDVPLPAGACDCHVHVFGPPGRYPFAENRTFMPSPNTVDDLVRLQQVLTLERAVIVQASPQGTDNRCLTDSLDALHRQGREARGVAVVDERTDEAELHRLHAAGVRGLRVNLESYGIASPEVATQRLRSTARIAAGMGWHVQIYTSLVMLETLADVIAQLGVPVVVDHFGLAGAAGGTAQPGFASLLGLVRNAPVYVKLSAPYRIVNHPMGEDGLPIARALIDARPDQMLWGTDWPHTNPPPGFKRQRDTPEPFRQVDDGHQLNIFASWTDEAERQRILVDNPARLYGFAAGQQAHTEALPLSETL